MRRTHFFLAAVGLLGTLFAIGAAPLEPAMQLAEQTLSSRGLTRIGTTYVVDDDAHLSARLKTMFQAKAIIEENAHKRAAIQDDLARTNDTLAKLYVEMRDASQKVAATPRQQVNYNQFVARYNFVQTNIKDGEKYKADREAELKNIVDPSDDYITAVLDVSDRMEAASKQYAALAADPQVNNAIAKLNEKAAPKVKLGPSAQFAQELPLIRKTRDAINSAVIQCDVSNGTAMVDAVFNGTVKQRVVVDSGASLVLIPASLAAKLGMKPGKNDPTVQSTIANGKKVTEHLMYVKSIRLGQFTVENVPCTVAAANETNVPCLIGGSFLRNFVYRMDLSTGQLHLSELPKPAAAPKTAATKPVAIATTNPSDSPSAAVPASGAPTSQPVATKIDIPAGDCKLICQSGQRILCILQSARGRGQRVVTASDKVRPDGLWEVKPAADGCVEIVNKNSNSYICVTRGQTTAGANIVQWDTGDRDDELWRLEPASSSGAAAAGGTPFKIVNKTSGLCLTAHDPSENGRGVPVTQEPWQDLDEQKWQFGAAEK